MLNRFTTSAKLYLLVIVMSGCIIGMGIYGIGNLKTMNHNTQTLYADRVLCLQQLTTVRYAYATDILSAAQQVKNHQLSYKDAGKQVQEALQRINVNWTVYMHTYLTPQEAQLAKQNETLMAQAGKTIEKLQGILDKEDTRGLNNIINKELYTDINPVITQLNELVQLQITVSAGLYKNSNEVYNSTAKKFYALIAASILLAFVLSFFIIGDTWSLIKNLEASNRKIAESEAKCRAFIKYAGDSIFMLDTSLRITDVNNSAVELTGYQRRELLQLKLSDIVSDDELASVNRTIDTIEREGGSLHERKYKRKDGSIIETEVNVRIVEGVGFIAIVRDISERKKAALVLREREALLTAIFDNMEGATSLLDEEKRYVLFNSRFIHDNRLLTNQYPYVGQQVYDGFPDEIRNERLKMLDNVLKGNKEVVEIDHVRDGKRVYYRTSFSPVITDGKVTGISTYSIDLTKSKEAELKIKESEEKFRQAFMTSTDAFYIRDTKDGRLMDVNDAYCTMFGYSREELIGKKVSDLNFYVNTGDQVLFDSTLREKGYVRDYELNLRKKNGELVTIEAANSVWKIKDGEFILGALRDITKRKKVENELVESEKKYRNIFENVVDVVFQTTLDGTILDVSPSAETLVGLTRQQLIGTRVDLLYYDQADREKGESLPKVLKKNGEAKDFQLRFKSATGEPIYISVNARIIAEADGTMHIDGMFRNITESKKVEEAIKESEQNYRSLFEQASDMIILTDLKASIVDINASGCQLLGYTREEMVGKNISQFIEPVHLKNDPIQLEELLRGKHNIRRRLAWRKNGETLEVESNTKRIFGDRILVIARDITELRIVEKQIELSEEKHRALVENIGDAIILIDENSHVIYQSPSVERISGFVLEEAQGGKVDEFIHPDDLDSFHGFFKQVSESPGVALQSQYRVLHKQGHYLWVEGTITNLLYDPSVNAFIVIYRDITARKKAEEEIVDLNESLEQKVIDRTAQLQEANKALEAFSYSVSHDLRAPLRAIIGFTKIIEKEHAPGFNADLSGLFGFIGSSSKRMNAIIDDMLTLAKYDKAKLQPTTVDMEKLFNNVWSNILTQTPHRATLRIAELPRTEADISMLEQVVVNLLSNAVKYSSKKEAPVVTVGYEKNDDACTFYVKDNGAGFDMKNYGRLFGAFQRLHGMSEFEGTGVGLTLVKRIVEKHGGTAWAEGKVNEGATFYFTLPIIGIQASPNFPEKVSNGFA